jgi:hypothetical protein
MAQLEQAGNLDRWNNRAYRLVTIILMRSRLKWVCLAQPGGGAVIR